MKNTAALLCTLLLTTIFAASCGNPAANSTANSNAGANSNANGSTAAAPTKEALFEMDKKANEAWIKGDKAHFEGMLASNFVSFERGTMMSRGDIIGMIGSMKCDVKSWSLDDPQMSKINDDTYAVVYKGTFDGSCSGPDGNSMKLPTPVRAVSIWVRDGSGWKGAFHSETLIVDTNNPPPAPAAEKKEAPAADTSAATNANAAPAPAKPAPSANTDALVKMHQAGWEAFKAKDAKWFNDNLAENFGLVGPMGDWVGSKAEAVKLWTETMKCEGITNVKVEDGMATAISPTVELLHVKGTADGTCNGQKNGPLYHSAVYVKQGDSWKLAFLFESPGA